MDNNTINSFYRAAQTYIDKIFDNQVAAINYAETRFVVLDESEDSRARSLFNSLEMYKNEKCKIMYINRENVSSESTWEPVITHTILGAAVAKPNIVIITEFRETTYINLFLTKLYEAFKLSAIGVAGATLNKCVHVKIIRLIDQSYTEDKDRKHIKALAEIMYRNFRLDKFPSGDYFPECAVAHMLKENATSLSRKIFLAGAIGQNHNGPSVDFLKAGNKDKFTPDDYPWIDVCIDKGDKNRMLPFFLIKDAIDQMRNTAPQTIINYLKNLPFNTLVSNLAKINGGDPNPESVSNIINDNMICAPTPAGSWQVAPPPAGDGGGVGAAFVAALIALAWVGGAGGQNTDPHSQNPEAFEKMSEWFAMDFCRRHPLEEFIKLYYSTTMMKNVVGLANINNSVLPRSKNTTLISDMYKCFKNNLGNMSETAVPTTIPWAKVIEKYNSMLIPEYVEYVYTTAENTLDEINDFLSTEMKENGVHNGIFKIDSINPFDDVADYLNPFSQIPIEDQIINFISGTNNDIHHNQDPYKNAAKKLIQGAAIAVGATSIGPAFLDINKVPLGINKCTTSFNYNHETIAVNTHYLDDTSLFTFSGIMEDE